ncbi:bifunctional 3'-5' exonuclease/DNA polymerase [Microbacterium horticulturae]|uniref:DNA-directed DNA polymerase n=1 Tax=Microbacterium horticulturae TaxID=3028316 RepID=A0ABY8C296_9MICO|nr:bifunctional 3'-5' exonuclease/DNA polymerase [Microbacterium sp. KACC 23027]WEG10415.1 bifunctional 3'-5' exonuclease/DNA polymerase [Microbacterium sp. KACC 23027]
MTSAGAVVLGTSGEGLGFARLDAESVVVNRGAVAEDGLAAFVAGTDASRWIWSDTAHWYPRLLDAGVRVARCRDLRLCHAILRNSALVAEPDAVRAATVWDAASTAAETDAAAPPLFDLSGGAEAESVPHDVDAVVAEYRRQREAVRSAAEHGRLELLCAAESAGALVAAEMRAAGLPWDVAEHERILTEELGQRPGGGGAPRRMAELAGEVRMHLGDAQASLDAPARLLRSLHRIGVPAQSVSKWELVKYDHPVIVPLLEYRRLSRLLAANGWAWLDEWVHDGRFRPVYVPAGVVTGRWASSGGGALQIPRMLRRAVRADDGWAFVVADVAQLEPRVLAGMANDLALARAAHGRDLYAGIVDSGAVATRGEAKVAMLGAMYGATTGESGRLVPRLRRAYPRAMKLVDEAARTGERGGVVSTWLGRSSPEPSEEWVAVQRHAAGATGTAAEQARAQRSARDHGRFTRNFVVQGTAAEWALAWLGEVRSRLGALDAVPASQAALRSGPALAMRPHLAFFLHDELIVHTPRCHADAAAEIVREAAASAGRLLFGGFPIDFPLDLKIAGTAAKQ